MLAKKYRIRTKGDFQKIYKSKSGATHPLLRAKKRVNEWSYPRFGIVVSTKIAKKATQRNLIKRRIRASLSSLIQHINKNVDIIFIAQPQIVGKDFHHIQRAIQELLRKMHIPHTL